MFQRFGKPVQAILGIFVSNRFFLKFWRVQLLLLKGLGLKELTGKGEGGIHGCELLLTRHRCGVRHHGDALEELALDLRVLSLRDGFLE